MKLFEISSEKRKGTYAGMRFCQETKKNLKELTNQFEVPEPLDVKEYHTTLLYSEKFLPEYKAQGKLDNPYDGTPVKCESWETQEGNNALVMTFKSPELSKRHSYLMKEHKATWGYPTFKPHVTLSYDCGDFCVKEINKYLKDAPFSINMVKEYHEDLNLDWAKENG